MRLNVLALLTLLLIVLVSLIASTGEVYAEDTEVVEESKAAEGLPDDEKLPDDDEKLPDDELEGEGLPDDEGPTGKVEDGHSDPAETEDENEDDREVLDRMHLEEHEQHKKDQAEIEKRDKEKKEKGEEGEEEVVDEDPGVPEYVPHALEVHDDINVRGGCFNPYNEFCKDVKPGKGALAHCLYAKYEEQKRKEPEYWFSTFNKQCKRELENWIRDSIRDMKRDGQVTHACKTDIEQHCSTKEALNVEGHEPNDVLACLKDNMTNLRESCKYGVTWFVMFELDDYTRDPDLQRDCSGDAARLCPGVEHGESRVLICLEKKMNQASFKCQKTFFRQQLVTVGADDYRLAKALHDTCSVEVENFCSDVKPGNSRVLQCLRSHKNELSFSTQCSKEFDHIDQVRYSDFRLNGALRMACKADVDLLCAKEYKDVMSNIFLAKHAIVYNCLQNNFDKITAQNCKKEVKVARAEIVKSFDKDAYLKTACDNFATDKCSEVDDDKKASCLTEHIDQFENDSGKNAQCGAALFTHNAQISGSIEYQPQMEAACASEISRSCAAEKTSRVEGAVIGCLEKKLWEEEFSEACQVAVQRYEVGAVDDYRRDYRLHRSCVYDVKRLCDYNCTKQQKSCHGRVQTCLKENYGAITIDRCKKRVQEVIYLGMEDIANDMYLANICTNDAVNLCKDVKTARQKGYRYIYSCLTANVDKVSETCADGLQARQQMIQGTVGMTKSVKYNCHAELDRLCKRDRTLTCLMKLNLDSTSLYDGIGKLCSITIEDQMVFMSRFIKNFRSLVKPCEKDVDKFCQADLKTLHFSDSADGKNLRCIIENGYRTAPACKKELTSVVRKLYKFYDKENPVTRVCDEDIEAQCADHLEDLRARWMCIIRMGPKFKNLKCKHQLDFFRTGGKRVMTDEEMATFVKALDNKDPKSFNELMDRMRQDSYQVEASGIVLTGWVAFLAVGALMLVLSGGGYLVYRNWSGAAKYRPYTIVTKSGDV